MSAVLRSIADAGPPATDADLLRRFLANDHEAFADLVRRHGRLVWAVCRHQTRSDTEADDAFQATFLVLLTNARKVRDPAKLSAWLHGVAYKVCAKNRQGAKRRTAREQAVATHEGNGSAVPESAWDRALAAVHEEVAALPDSLRVPFVLCCFEGKGVTEAADQLGWKLGTLSGRLTRAKDAVLTRLAKRGLTAGVVAGVGLACPPAAVAARAMTLTRTGAAVPESILQLSQGVIEMSVKPVKLLAAAVILVCGLGTSVGPRWMATAGAQPPGTSNTQAETLRLKAVLDVAQAQGKLKETTESDAATFKTTKHEYDLIVVSDLSRTKFRELLQRYEDRGWEYAGTTPLDDPKQLVWVFRRPIEAGRSRSANLAVRDALTRNIERPRSVDNYKSTLPAQPPKADDPKELEAEIKRLQDRLDTARKPAADKPQVVSFDKSSTTFAPATLAVVLTELGQKKFGRDGKFRVTHNSNGVLVYGDKAMIDWASGVVKQLASY